MKENIYNFTPVSDKITQELDTLAALVYGKIWRYNQMKDGVCRASQIRIAKELGISDDTVNDRLKRLEAAGYIVDKTPDLRNKPHLIYVTGKNAFPEYFDSSTSSGSKDSVTHPAVASYTSSGTQSRPQRDEERREESIEESRPTPSKSDEHGKEKGTARGIGFQEGIVDDAGKVIDRLKHLTGHYFHRDKSTVEVAKFILAREAEGQSLETFLANVSDARKQKYPSFPADIMKEWTAAFENQQHLPDGV